ncbi:LysM peptidoglycan-binding domain-containing protein [Paenibacillus taichungensis]|uniref:LysM peptidoglycan-binding domain-containing protein n=1 Tax=Paenibacillus taichungensis TaxID=484184 RepID=UPI002DBE5DAC|nr:LysM peptidoglycan-binding domain-containing protein [Paenibacillus taichungensis]MEC0107774.1 LysM peptidoglycan-binding domain-containing protein [Paenibacillus taichungensis]MEC0200614.1 LysM peptidoglycan-binding domain-containing protein [Paenibacillus taichungensis]
MRYSTYQSIYEPVRSEMVETNIRNFKKVFAKGNVPTWVLKLIIVSLIILVGCSTVLTVFAGNEKDLLPGGKMAVSQGDTLWSISLDHKPETMDTRVYIEAIKKVNQLQSTSIQVGQVLILPQFTE